MSKKIGPAKGEAGTDRVYGLYKEGKLQLLSEDDVIRFSCARCGDCCLGVDVVLTPADVRKAAVFLGMKPLVFIKEFCNVAEEPHSGRPIVWLRKEPNCPFLHFTRTEEPQGPSPESVRTSCSIYSARPMSCTQYPIGRMLANGDWKIFMSPRPCPGLGKGQEMTVRRYVEVNGLRERWKESDKFVEESTAFAKAHVPWKLAFRFFYDFEGMIDEMRQQEDEAAGGTLARLMEEAGIQGVRRTLFDQIIQKNWTEDG